MMTTTYHLRDIKIKMTPDGLRTVIRTIESFVIFPDNDMEMLVFSILSDLLRSLKKKIIDMKQKYTITLRIHEAITLRKVLLTGGYPYESYEENEIRIITTDIGRQL